MKVISKTGAPGPYVKDEVYDCDMELIDDKYFYRVISPEGEARIAANISGYCSRFSKEYFDQFFIHISELRRQKIEKLNGSR